MKFQNVYAHICTCHKLPPDGCFTVGKEYGFTYMIDAEQIVDDNGVTVTLCEKTFNSCFGNVVEAVTSYCPIAQDKTIYHVFLVQNENGSNKEEIRACAKILNINYLRAREKLSQDRCLLAKGNAMEIQDILERLAAFDVDYKIEPPYPYE